MHRLVAALDTHGRTMPTRRFAVLALTVAMACIGKGIAAPACPAETVTKVTVTESDGSGRPLRRLVFGLTDIPVHTCLGGDWKRARVLQDATGYTTDPAYSLHQGKLEILLVNGVCDAYDSYVGVLENGRFTGKHVGYGMQFSKMLGDVSGTYTSEGPSP
jgi:hypothetical protein